MLSRTAQGTRRVGLIALSIASYTFLCGNRLSCDEMRAPSITCQNIPLIAQPGTCTVIANPCAADGQWVGPPRFDGFRLCDAPDGITVRTTRAGSQVTREICIAPSAPLLINEDIEFVYGRGTQIGTASLVLTTGAPLSVTVGATPSTINAGESSQLTASASGGVAPYFYSWTPANDLDDSDIAAPTATPEFTTEYRVRVQDSAGQEAIASVTVTVIAELEVTATPAVVEAGQPSALLAEGEGGVPPYTFSWMPVETLDDASRQDPTATPVHTTTYQVTMTDSTGMVLSGSVQVRVLMAATASADPNQVTNGETSQLDVVTVGGLPPYSYSWTPPETLSDPSIQNPVATPNSTTTYNVTVTDAQGFQTAASVNVDLVSSAPPPTAYFDYSVVCCPSLNVDATGSTGNIVSYTWDLGWTSASPDRITTSPTTNFPIREFDRGTITLTVTADDGQTASFTRTF
jgi:hypothetical protein